MNKVPTALALAFINAAVKNKQDLVKVDHTRWLARCVASCAERDVGMVPLSKGSTNKGQGKIHAN